MTMPNPDKKAAIAFGFGRDRKTYRVQRFEVAMVSL